RIRRVIRSLILALVVVGSASVAIFLVRTIVMAMLTALIVWFLLWFMRFVRGVGVSRVFTFLVPSRSVVLLRRIVSCWRCRIGIRCLLFA
ncbi:hypothetical protein KXX35_002480, partial [Aspergillus fumigatus]